MNLITYNELPNRYRKRAPFIEYSIINDIITKIIKSKNLVIDSYKFKYLRKDILEEYNNQYYRTEIGNKYKFIKALATRKIDEFYKSNETVYNNIIKRLHNGKLPVIEFNGFDLDIMQLALKGLNLLQIEDELGIEIDVIFPIREWVNED